MNTVKEKRGIIGRLFDRLVMRLEAWGHRRYWTAEKQMYWMRVTILNDHQWMAHDPVAKAITERYLSMLVEDWETVRIESTRDFRERIGLKPKGGA